jgi:hypothetical protein
MTDIVFDAAANVGTRKHANAWWLFLILISAATLLPFAVVPLASHVVPEGNSALYVYSAIGFLGANFHVASTGWFYTDPEIRSLFRAHPVRYLIVPCVLVLGSAAAFYLLDQSPRLYLVAGFICWQLWHYQKQNVGVLSFIAAGTDGTPLSIWERRTLGLSAIAGILGFFSVAQAGPPSLSAGPMSLSAEFLLLHQIGAAICWLLPIVFCFAVVKNPVLRTNKLRLLFFLFGTLFFFPTFVFTDSLSELAGYGMAHGLQYLVFMGFVSVGKHKAMTSLVKLLIIATCGALILDRAASAQSWPDFSYGYAIYGAFVGVVMAHFVLDTGIWRLREPFQRGYMRKKFYFVFDR